MLAGRLYGRIVVLCAANGLLDAAAARRGAQIQENAKNLAFHHLLPEMNHNEILGWKNPSSLLGDLAVVFLKDGQDHEQIRRRFDLTAEILAREASVVEEVRSFGIPRLARLFHMIYTGDWVSL